MQTAVTYWAIDNKSWSKLLKSRQAAPGKVSAALFLGEGLAGGGEENSGGDEKLLCPLYSLHLCLLKSTKVEEKRYLQPMGKPVQSEPLFIQRLICAENALLMVVSLIITTPVKNR